jgi:hypothetical protein
MPVGSAGGVSNARNINLRAADAVSKVEERNKKSELGSVSIRFHLAPHQDGIYPSSKELTPAQAMVEMMAGHTVEATTVTWKTYSRSGKRGSAPTLSQKTRVKIRNSEVGSFDNVADFEKWAGPALDGATGNTGPTPTRPRRSQPTGNKR